MAFHITAAPRRSTHPCDRHSRQCVSTSGGRRSRETTDDREATCRAEKCGCARSESRQRGGGKVVIHAYCNDGLRTGWFWCRVPPWSPHITASCRFIAGSGALGPTSRLSGRVTTSQGVPRDVRRLCAPRNERRWFGFDCRLAAGPRSALRAAVHPWERADGFLTVWHVPSYGLCAPNGSAHLSSGPP